MLFRNLWRNHMNPLNIFGTDPVRKDSVVHWAHQAVTQWLGWVAGGHRHWYEALWKLPSFVTLVLVWIGTSKGRCHLQRIGVRSLKNKVRERNSTKWQDLLAACLIARQTTIMKRQLESVFILPQLCRTSVLTNNSWNCELGPVLRRLYKYHESFHPPLHCILDMALLP